MVIPLRWSTLTLLLVPAAPAQELAPLVSPGYISAAHTAIEARCDRCHTPFQGLPDQRCLTCHPRIEELQQTGTGFHGQRSDGPCVSCHTDHRGREMEPTREVALAAFDHAMTGFTLGGQHRRLDCGTCHDRALERLGAGCADCHSDPHQGLMGQDCGTCHGDASWNRLAKTLSGHQLDMSGAHGALACGDCHAAGEGLSSTVSCASCHEDGHGGTSTDCEACHQATGWTPAAFDHGPCGCAFPGKHQTAPCLACHEGFSFVNTPSACEACHEDDLGHDPLGPCARCHTADSWTEQIFDHDTSAFPLEGAHLSVSCAQCHPERSFGGVSTSCESCHAGEHQEAHPDFGDCGRCHSAETFSSTSFEHEHAGFPLTDHHAAASCWACHPTQLEGYKE